MTDNTERVATYHPTDERFYVRTAGPDGAFSPTTLRRLERLAEVSPGTCGDSLRRVRVTGSDGRVAEGPFSFGPYGLHVLGPVGSGAAIHFPSFAVRLIESLDAQQYDGPAE